MVTEIWGGINTGGYRNLGFGGFSRDVLDGFQFFCIITGGYRILGCHYHRWLQNSGVALSPVVTEIWGGINTGGYRNLGRH